MEQIRQNIAQEEAILPDNAEALEIVVPAVGDIPSFRFVCRQQAYGLSVHTPMLPSIRDLSDTLTGICEARRGKY